jgi:hypothetical protein
MKGLAHISVIRFVLKITPCENASSTSSTWSSAIRSQVIIDACTEHQRPAQRRRNQNKQTEAPLAIASRLLSTSILSICRSCRWFSVTANRDPDCESLETNEKT